MCPGFGTAIKDYRVVYVGAGKPPVGGNIDTGKTTLHAVCRPQELNRGAIPGDDAEDASEEEDGLYVQFVRAAQAKAEQ